MNKSKEANMLRAFLVFLLLLIVTPASAQETIIVGDKLKEVFSDATAYITHRNGQRQVAYLRANGTAKINVRDGFKEAVWNIEGDTICHGLSSEHKCYQVYLLGNDTYRLLSTDNKWMPTYTIKRGNVENY